MQTCEVKTITPDQVHDGDTIEAVHVRLMPATAMPEGEVWPELYIKKHYLYAVFNLRLDGIDTPELHPKTHYPNGQERSEASRNAEKAKANEARQALIDILATADKILVGFPKEGKYAGRLVAKLFIERNNEQIDVCQYMIDNNYAVPYEGGTKIVWDFGS